MATDIWCVYWPIRAFTYNHSEVIENTSRLAGIYAINRSNLCTRSQVIDTE